MLKIISLKEAVNLISQGKLIIFPTETFFGLGCKIFNNDDTIQQIFIAKQRTINIPLPIIIGNWEQLTIAAEVPQIIYPLLQHFWPGALSIILNAKQNISPYITASTQKVAVRLSSHPIAKGIADLVGEPIIATSANINKHPPVTNITQLDTRLFPYIEGIIDIPPTPTGGLPSTLIELYPNNTISILREGIIKSNKIKKKAAELCGIISCNVKN